MSLRITDNLGTQNVPLNGVATQVKLSAASLAFGAVAVGVSKNLPVTLTNFGSTAVTIISPGIVITGTAGADYSQTNNCGTSVGAGQTCTITVAFKPTKIGSRGATLNINDNGGPSSAEGNSEWQRNLVPSRRAGWLARVAPLFGSGIQFTMSKSAVSYFDQQLGSA